MKLITNAEVIWDTRPPRPGEILLEGGTITALGEPGTVPAPAEAQVMHTEGRRVVPGFVESHIHGARGRSFMDADEESVREITRHRAAHGTTCLAATTWTEDEEHLIEAIQTVRRVMAEQPVGARICGLNLEGPYISPQRPGAMKQAAIVPADIGQLQRLWEAAGGEIRVMTIAPEVPRALPAIHWLSEHGVAVSLGHSNADFRQANAAIAAGAAVGTHVFDTMPQLHHRDLSLTTALLTDDRVTAEIICDGIHVAPLMVKLLYRAKGPERTCIITDSVAAAGLPDGVYERHGMVTVIANGQAHRDTESGPLAGSTLTMDRALLNMMEFADVTLEQASIMASMVPARVLSQDCRTGSIAVGKDADIVIIDHDDAVWATLVQGEVVYSRTGEL